MSKRSALKFQIGQLRLEQIVLALESITVFVGALFTTALLPQILFKYLYANAQLTEEPALLAKIPDIAFAVGAVVFVYVLVRTLMISMKLGKLQTEFMNMAESDCDMCCTGCEGGCACGQHDSCMCGSCEDDMHGMTEMTEEVEMVSPAKMAEKMKTASASKKKPATRKK